ncbi:MAG: HNH endonuclease signature motif containing protein, partial [Bacteroidota bacterium]
EMTYKMETPAIVDKIVEIVSEKIGREAICRKVNNRDEYLILDLAFSYFQKADRNRHNDYRTGYLYFKKDKINYLLFVIRYSPIMMTFFSKNFDYQKFRKIITDTSQYRDENYLCYYKSEKAKRKRIKTKDNNEFLAELDNIEQSWGMTKVLKKHINTENIGGNIFYIGLARKFKEKDINDIIDKSWDLFLWLYPSKPLFKRNASLNRSLRPIKRVCEINHIKGLPKSISQIKCSETIEGAHIIPHQKGGSDKLENGVWLCSTHHRKTEGKLTSKRSIDRIEVKYKKL